MHSVQQYAQSTYALLALLKAPHMELLVLSGRHTLELSFDRLDMDLLLKPRLSFIYIYMYIYISVYMYNRIPIICSYVRYMYTCTLHIIFCDQILALDRNLLGLLALTSVAF